MAKTTLASQLSGLASFLYFTLGSPACTGVRLKVLSTIRFELERNNFAFPEDQDGYLQIY